MTSRFVSLSNYCILEYRMTSLGDPSPEIINSDYFFVKNANVGLYQIYNTDTAYFTNTTKNTRGSSVVPIGGSILAAIDLTNIPIYTKFDPNIIETQIANSYTNSVVVDTLRFHFASGFNFTEVENIVLGARQRLNNLKQIQLANVLVNSLTAQTLLTFNSQPLMLANSIYDKYVDIKIPNSAQLDKDYEQFGASSFEYIITEGSGFISNSPITVSLSEVVYDDLFASNGVTYESYRVNQYFEGSVPQVNEFDNLGAVVQEATDGDYIQFFATWNGAFPSELIATLNARGSDQNWILVHQLQVYEQIGTSNTPSGNLLVYQEDKFDEPLSYRPILMDAGFAVSMSIDYTVRLLNKNTGEQVIRDGSLSIFNPNRYGKNLLKLALADNPQSMKVFNKVVQNSVDATFLFTGKKPVSTQTSAPTVITREVKVGVPILYKQQSIRISHKNALLRTSGSADEVIYGQGEMVLPIDPTDNFIKFTVYEADQKDPTKQAFANLNTNSKFALVFGKDAALSYSSLTDPAYENPSRGQIAFKIPKDQAKKILQLSDNLVYVTVIAEDGTETLLYTGTWQSSANYAAIINAADTAKSALVNDPQSIIAGLQATIQTLQTENEHLKHRSAIRPSSQQILAQAPQQSASGSQAVSQPLEIVPVIKETYQTINPISSVQPLSNLNSKVNEVTTTTTKNPGVYTTSTTTRRTQGPRGIQAVPTLR